LPSGQYDVVIAVAVLEHVPSPTAFIAEMRRLLVRGGVAVLIQPTQEVPSYDVFFVDHLHHFSARHLSGYAMKAGFAEAYARVGYEFMPNFSAHAWVAGDVVKDWTWRDAPARTSCSIALETVIADMARVDETAERLSKAGKPFGVFGLYEVFALTRAYSNIEQIGIAVGLDDVPDNPEYRQYPFRVSRPENTPSEVRDMFLTMNRIYYEQARTRLDALGIQSHPVLS
jgi:SAM-dependent methyltransferase